MNENEINKELSEYTPYSSEWGNNAPRGGKSVMGRILKDGAKVPLFLGQTLVKSLRDMGYNHATSAVCEHVDNAIQWGASEVRVYFHQRGGQGGQIDVLIYDNGKGMAPHVLKVGMSFGGSLVYDNRNGIGRYGMGMKTAALSMGPILEVYTWQEQGAFYSMILDTEEIGANRSNLIEQPDPKLLDKLPDDILKILTKRMAYPNSDQQLLVDNNSIIEDTLRSSGTIIYIPNCDRLHYKRSRTLVDHAIKEMARVYRYFINKGVKIYVNNKLVDAFDPTFWMDNARHTKIEELTPKRSIPVEAWHDIQIPTSEDSRDLKKISVRLYMLPKEWMHLPQKTQKNDLHIFDDNIVSFMRNNREVHSGVIKELSGAKHSDTHWLRIQIDFTGELDEAFGVAANKQGVRPKEYVYEAINNKIKGDVTRVRSQIKEIRSAYVTLQKNKSGVPTESERRASDADYLLTKPILAPSPQTEEEQKVFDEALKAFAVTLKKGDETDKQAIERVRNSKYLTTTRHDSYWPFYHAETRFGKVILTINTAHPFFSNLYEPLCKIAASSTKMNNGNEEFEFNQLDIDPNELVVTLELLLISLARTQAIVTQGQESQMKEAIFQTFLREWSDTLKSMVSAP